MRIDRLAARDLGEFWSLREDVMVLPGPSMVLRTPWGELRLERPGLLLREALHRMQLGPVSLGNVVPGFPGYDVPEGEWNDASRELLDALDSLQHLIVRHLSLGASPLLSVVPLSPDARFCLPPVAPGAECRLSSDVVLRGTGHDPVLAYEGADHRVELHGPDASRLLLHLRGAYSDFQSPFDGSLSEEVVRAARSYTAAAGMLAIDDAKGGARL
ncbi:hypothetical protein [Streptomyces sp. NBC_01431]|jgi:hypothetical protein|uniref:hypothetical protein n=1 Tax=Streptomyces sp. NBC_01431 TaxID=2903863 RepID=UPI002E33BCC5|nr:hypothetical protein [Streptomyces sp. NBC_01431]